MIAHSRLPSRSPAPVVPVMFSTTWFKSIDQSEQIEMERSQDQVEDVARRLRCRRRYRMTSGVGGRCQPVALATGHAMLVTMVRTAPVVVSVTVPFNCPMATSAPSSIAKRLIEKVPAIVPTFCTTPAIGTSSRLVLFVSALRECARRRDGDERSDQCDENYERWKNG